MNVSEDATLKETERQIRKYKELTESKIEFLVIKMGIPTIISMLTTSFYNMADTFFVSKINTQSTAAVGIVFSMMAIIQAIGFFSDMVQAIIYQLNLERRKQKKLQKWLLQVFYQL